MEHRRLGNSGLKVSTLCLGAMMFGDRTTEDVAARIVDSALDAGVNFIDILLQQPLAKLERLPSG